MSEVKRRPRPIKVLTVHGIDIIHPTKGKVHHDPDVPKEQSPRVDEISTLDEYTAEGYEVFEVEYGEVTNLPPEQDEFLFVVPLAVRLALPLRKDLISPGELTRDENGNPYACRGVKRAKRKK